MAKNPKPRPLSKREEAWIARLQRCLDACPNKRLGFYTIGDNDVTIYDRRFDDQVHELMDAGRVNDFGPATDAVGADLNERVLFPSAVHSVAG